MQALSVLEEKTLSVAGYFRKYLFFRKEIVPRVFPLNELYDRAVDFELYLLLRKAGARFHYFDKSIVNVASGGVSYNSLDGYFQIRDISLKHGCGKLRANFYLISKILERKASDFLLKIGLKKLRKLIAEAVYPNSSIQFHSYNCNHVFGKNRENNAGKADDTAWFRET